MDPTDKLWGDEFYLYSNTYRHATARPWHPGRAGWNPEEFGICDRKSASPTDGRSDFAKFAQM